MSWVRCSRIIAVLLAGFAWSTPGYTAEHRYSARLDADLSVLQMRACFDSDVPSRLVAGSDFAREALKAARTTALKESAQESSSATPLELGRRSLRLDGIRSGGCVDYTVDLRVLRNSYYGARSGGADLLTKSGDWLWLDPSEAREPVELSFELPKGISVSAPWAEVAVDSSDDARPTFRIGPAPIEWEDHVAFGSFAIERVAVPGAQLRLSILDGGPLPADGALRKWLSDSGNAVAQLYGRFPLQSVQVLLVPRRISGKDAIAYGQVMRGGAPATLFIVDGTAPIQSLREDWTAVHELSHLLLPYITRNDAWASEGFASYFQNVLRARGGMLTPRGGWERLEAGFERGRKATRSGSLGDASRRMHGDGQLMRVYWAGAAIALRLDVELRKSSGGRQSLSSALEKLAVCCLQSPSTWTARELFARIDALSGTSVAGELYDSLVPASAFPDLQATYRDLGLKFRQGRVVFDDDAPLAAVRTDIMAAGR